MNLPNFQIKPHQLSPLLATPRSIALLFAGAAAYVGFIDPQVRDSLHQTRQKLRHWATMYKTSIKVMGSLSILGAVFGTLCYYKSKEKLWLIGGALMGSLWPYTLLVLMPTNKSLMATDQAQDPTCELSSGQKYSVVDKITYWVKGHRGRVLISLVAAGIFYLAELKSTQNVNVSLSLK